MQHAICFPLCLGDFLITQLTLNTVLDVDGTQNYQ